LRCELPEVHEEICTELWRANDEHEAVTFLNALAVRVAVDTSRRSTQSTQSTDGTIAGAGIGEDGGTTTATVVTDPRSPLYNRKSPLGVAENTNKTQADIDANAAAAVVEQNKHLLQLEMCSGRVLHVRPHDTRPEELQVTDVDLGELIGVR
jgi:hypothetical protein